MLFLNSVDHFKRPMSHPELGFRRAVEMIDDMRYVNEETEDIIGTHFRVCVRGSPLVNTQLRATRTMWEDGDSRKRTELSRSFPSNQNVCIGMSVIEKPA